MVEKYNKDRMTNRRLDTSMKMTQGNEEQKP